MKIIDENGNKHYEFEAGDDELRLELEQAILIPDYELILGALVRAAAKQKLEAITAWRKIKQFITQLDPEYMWEEMTYNTSSMRMTLQKIPNAQVDEKQIAKLKQEILEDKILNLIKTWNETNE